MTTPRSTSDGQGRSQTQPPGERVLARLHPHARRLIWSAIVLVAVVGVMAFFAGNLPQAWQNTALIVAGIAVIGLACLVPFVIWSGRHYVITTRRVIVRRGVITRIRQELLHSRGYDVTVRQNPIQRMFGSGDVLVNTGLDSPLVLRDVPGAELVADVLQDLMEQGANQVSMRRQYEESQSRPEIPRGDGRQR